MTDELGCPGCMSDDIREEECELSCDVDGEHRHLFCNDCDYAWTENS